MNKTDTNRKKKRLNLTISKGTREKLQKHAEENKLSISEFVAMLVDNYDDKIRKRNERKQKKENSL